ncbi:unnamed protein product [Bursaphelenchus xylophilus]|uniref:(pine wood nematode) hypothetical protein n=1 Tax=Bursaphelenchus xylophilus TaxID=6326 RepID=A0A1I7RXE4_BURXY|nr:unnamed protein product [Bursaphelenchus xylophilus]CAG9126326.1 unnamed protein product [Bursaphelenchus xylophilus]
MVHENLRKCILLLNFFICFSPIIHPLTVYLDTDDAPLQHKNYKQALLIYGMNASNHVSLLCLHCKFFILIAERVLAYRKREVYENTKNNYVVRIFGVTFILCFVELAFKLTIFLSYDTEDAIDVRLLKALTISESPRYFLISFFICYNCGIIGYLCFRRLQRIALEQRHKSRSLSERFELRQTEVITSIMLYLSKVYICFLIGCSLSLIPTVRLAFWPSRENWKRLFRLAILYLHCGVGAYNAVTTVYTFRKMKFMFRTAPLDANAASRKGHVDQYFLKLQNDWKIGVNKG